MNRAFTYLLGIALISLASFSSFSQYYTQTEIDSIHTGRLGQEGDMYLDTNNGTYSIGTTNGEIKNLGVNYFRDTLTDSLVSFDKNFSFYVLEVIDSVKLDFINVKLGHKVFLKTYGDTIPTFPINFELIQGDFRVGDTSFVELICNDTSDGGYFTGILHQTTEQITKETVSQIENQFDIFKGKLDAENGDLAKAIKICPVGTNISTNVVSYADGNVVYIKRNGAEEFDTLARLNKHEIFTFNASQGDRVYSLYGDAVISNAFGTVAWISLALAGREFYTYVARNATGANPASLFISSFDADVSVVILKNGNPYVDTIVPANSVMTIDLDAIAEFYIKSDILCGLWYVANNNTTDAKPLPPVSSELLWWNTAFSAGFVPRISALYPNTNIEIKYRDGTSETAVVNPGTPFSAKYGAGPYAQYAANGGAIVRADGIISGANAADQDGNNGTAWYSKNLTAQHFVLPVLAEHISFVSLYEGDILVRNATDDSVTTIRMTRGASVTADQSYPATVKYTPPGGGKGFSFECQVPAHCVFDNNESGLAGDETVLFGGKLETKDGIILKDRGTKQNMRIFIEGGVIQVESL